MSLYRVRIELRAPLGTALTSGTLFGHLCWARRQADGEAALVSWLASLAEAPWAVSDGFPADLLPRPLVRREPPARPERMTAETLRQLEEKKQRSKRAWLRVEDWRKVRERVSDPILDTFAEDAPTRAKDAPARAKDAPAGPHRIAHNAIDRRTGSTPEEGGLFFVDEDWSHGAQPHRDIYVRAETSAEELAGLFAAVGEAGYGRDATWGRGHFAVVDVTDAGWLDDHDGNRMLSLSHGCLSATMAEPRYKLFTHFGKVGAGLLAEGVRAWKYPILLARPGCTFRAVGEGPFGAWLTGVHQDRPEVGHNAFHVAVPFTDADE